ncbi:phosphoribosylanthranilate isomerase [Terriglobus roseus DSM 18391]|uniref:N-(5'-phosphoribosyl)anthranilate isomerase n=1 Tax=Terriglobus roseus (strain DSM 18391 / NRRL B-41598 / KBS 63) TaxID=926566 RepID=I3ZCK8_TERRK|nr:phosphoribosylanthranilate isomerase [Terriglobus roseus]AFL86976.1 phosphoribosylanthranilate isomerase [Terriglobus roseus DSM 18391]
MWIKICGNTRLEDCVVAAEAGADAVGFIFASGKRLITAQDARAITSELPETLETIGVFTQTNAAQILATAAAAGITGIQLHSAFDPRRAAIIRRQFPKTKGRMRVLQVVHWLTDVSAETQMERFRVECKAIAASGLADALLVDSRTAEASGGTGVTFDWSAAASALQGLSLPVIVAGGLRPENVGPAIEALHPDGVDTSSGVEVSPGVKDHDRVRAFVGVVRG